MSWTTNTHNASRSTPPTWLDNLEQIAAIIDRHLKWAFILATLLYHFDSLPEFWRIPALLSVGSASTIKKIVDLYKTLK